MPKELIAISPGKAILRNYEEEPLKANQIRIKSTISAEKHGTRLSAFRGVASDILKEFDGKYGLFYEKKDKFSSFPFHLGNMTAGVVIEIGENVKKFKIGDRVYGYLPIRETHTVEENAVSLIPENISDEEIVCLDPALVAFMAIREGDIKLGDNVSVFGLGAIGLFIVQMAKLSGARVVIGVEPIEKRRELGKKFGADFLLNPFECDAGLEIRKLMDMKGVDVGIEVSGSYKALHHTIRGTRFGGRIIPVSYYHGEATGLNLGEEWHFNRQIMLSGARIESCPYREYPLWDTERVKRTVLEMFSMKKLKITDILCPIVKFEDVLLGYEIIDKRPEEAVKLAVKYD